MKEIMKETDFRKMLPLYGKWKVATVNFLSQEGKNSNHALILLGKSIDDGIIECNVKFPHANLRGFCVFRANGQESFYGAGLGGKKGMS